MNSLVESKGYTTKAEICDNINKNLPEYEDVITSNDVAKLFRLFKKQIEREWIHKQPSAAERQQYGYTGNRWIFKRR